MALSIKDEETDALIRELAGKRKIGLTAAVKLAVVNELKRQPSRERPSPADRLMLIERVQRQIDCLPVLDGRSMDDLLGYDEAGLPQ